MFKKLPLLFNTVKHLKPIQVFYQFKYRLIKADNLAAYNKTYSKNGICFLSFSKQPPAYKGYLGKNIFSFLNLEVRFDNNIDWNYQEHGKLWNYNLQYANYLLQEEVPVKERKSILLSLYQSLNSGYLPLEPYPVSLRSINCIRFLSHNKIVDSELTSFLHGELDFLTKRLEYHLLGNHLLENAFALLMGGAFFSKQEWVQQGQSVLQKELEEQTLQDGAHFELSPMYHQIIFFRLLELIDWYKQWEGKEAEFLSFLENKASLMLSWLCNISFENGDIPHFNDSTEGISYSTRWLQEYATSLSIRKKDIALGLSGYRSFKNAIYECKIDLAQVGPSYQPGHAQADALSFILYYKGKPLFVEMGTSTYEINERRALERGTAAHNTVVVNNKDQSKVWSGFRVAQRAKTVILEDKGRSFTAQHDGYRNFGAIHNRKFEFMEDSVLIKDTIQANDASKNQCHLHLHPSIQIGETSLDTILLKGIGQLHFAGATKLDVQDYEMAHGYNNYLLAKKIVITFDKNLVTTISFNKNVT